MTLIISNKDMNDIIKIIKALENSNILIKGVSKTIKNDRKEQKVGFLSMLLSTVGASLLGNLLRGKGILKAGTGRPLSSTLKNKKGKGILRPGSGYKKGKGIVRAGSGHPLSSTLKKEWDF